MSVLHLATRLGQALTNRLGLRLRVRGIALGPVARPGITVASAPRDATVATLQCRIADRMPSRTIQLIGT